MRSRKSHLSERKFLDSKKSEAYGRFLAVNDRHEVRKMSIRQAACLFEGISASKMFLAYARMERTECGGLQDMYIVERVGLEESNEIRSSSNCVLMIYSGQKISFTF